MTRVLSEEDTARWEDDGPEGQLFRAHIRDQTITGAGHYEIHSHDGITLEAWDVAEFSGSIPME